MTNYDCNVCSQVAFHVIRVKTQLQVVTRYKSPAHTQCPCCKRTTLMRMQLLVPGCLPCHTRYNTVTGCVARYDRYTLLLDIHPCSHTPSKLQRSDRYIVVNLLQVAWHVIRVTTQLRILALYQSLCATHIHVAKEGQVHDCDCCSPGCLAQYAHRKTIEQLHVAARLRGCS